MYNLTFESKLLLIKKLKKRIRYYLLFKLNLIHEIG